MSVAYDVTGVGNHSSSGTSISYTVAANSGDFVLVGIDTAAATATLSNVQFSGSAMTLVDSINHGGTASNGTLSVYSISGVSGSGTVTATISTTVAWESQAVCYTGVGSAASLAKASALASNISTGSQTCPSNGMLVAFLASGSGTAPTMSTATGGTNRYLNVAGDSALCISDSTSTATFGVTTNFDYNGYIVVSLSPPAGTTVTPTTATITITGSTPSISNPGAPITPATATVTVTGSTPTIILTSAYAPTTATVHITGGTPLVSNGNAFAPLITQLAAGNSAIIECVGDSTVNGFGDGAAIGGWPTRIGLILGAQFNYNVTTQSSVNGTRTTQSSSTLGGGAPTVAIANFGVDGYTIAQVDGLATAGALTQTGASVVMIGAGFNDISPGNQTPSQIVTRMQTLVSDLQSRLPGVPIVVTTQDPQSPDTNALATFSAVSTAYTGNALPLTPPLQQSATSPGVWVLDSRQAFADVFNAALMTDSEHPNSTGYWQEANFAVAQMPVSTIYAVPTTATIHITGGTPTVSASALNYTGSPATATITITGGTPSVTNPVAVSPTTATITITGGTPAVSDPNPATASPTTATITITGGVPGVTGTTKTVSPATATIHITGGLSVLVNGSVLTELVFFEVTAFYYDLQSPSYSGNTNDAVLTGISGGNVTFTARLPSGFTILIADLDLGSGNVGSTALALPPITGRVVGAVQENGGTVWQLCANNSNNSPGLQLVANSAAISSYLTAENINEGQLIYDVEFSDVTFAGETGEIANFAFAAPTTNAGLCLTDTGSYTVLPWIRDRA